MDAAGAGAAPDRAGAPAAGAVDAEGVEAGVADAGALDAGAWVEAAGAEIAEAGACALAVATMAHSASVTRTVGIAPRVAAEGKSLESRIVIASPASKMELVWLAIRAADWLAKIHYSL